MCDTTWHAVKTACIYTIAPHVLRCLKTRLKRKCGFGSLSLPRYAINITPAARPAPGFSAGTGRFSLKRTALSMALPSCTLVRAEALKRLMSGKDGHRRYIQRSERFYNCTPMGSIKAGRKLFSCAKPRLSSALVAPRTHARMVLPCSLLSAPTPEI